VKKGILGHLVIIAVLGATSCRTRTENVMKNVEIKQIGLRFTIPESWKHRYFDYTLHNVVPPHLEISDNFTTNHILFNSQSGKMEVELSEDGFWISVSKLGKIADGELYSSGNNEYIVSVDDPENWILQNSLYGIRVDIRRADHSHDTEFEEFLGSISRVP